MTFRNRERLIVISLNLILSLFCFWLARYFGGLPRWWWLVLSAVIWVIIGELSGKLHYREYLRTIHACIAIVTVDILCTLLLYVAYKHFVYNSDKDYETSLLIAGVMLSASEIFIYLFVRRIFHKKLPYQYESIRNADYAEKGLGKPLDLKEEVWNEDIPLVIDKLKDGKKIDDVIRGLKNAALSDKTIVTDVLSPDSNLNTGAKVPTFIILSKSLNNAAYLNHLLAHINKNLSDGGYMACYCQTIRLRRQRLMSQNPIGVNYLIAGLDYFWHKIIGRGSLTKHFYKRVSYGRKRSIHRVELLGRIYRAGFEVVCEGICGDNLYVIASKKTTPISDEKPNTGMLIRLRRIGKEGKEIGVYKFRTMFAYSEYLQPYIYQQEGLCKGGKIADDYRITRMGRFLRSVWLDELPMIINWMKGDMKLIGIRPLSPHYFSLYSKELQELRTKIKPGLFPPFYADMPETLEEIQDSEMCYLKAYFQSPKATDWKYFWAGFVNIVFKNKRSK